MKFKADETHYKSKRLHLYLYFRSRAVQGFSSREPPTCTPPRARAHALPGAALGVGEASASEAPGKDAFYL